MFKTLLAIIAGLVVAFALVFMTDALFHSLSTANSPSSNDPDALRDYVAGQPMGVLCGIMAGWAVAAFLGSAIASRFSAYRQWPGLVVTALFLVATAANFMMVEHPTWMVVGAVVAIIMAGWLGSRTRARAAPPAQAQEALSAKL